MLDTLSHWESVQHVQHDGGQHRTAACSCSGSVRCKCTVRCATKALLRAPLQGSLKCTSGRPAWCPHNTTTMQTAAAHWWNLYTCAWLSRMQGLVLCTVHTTYYTVTPVCKSPAPVCLSPPVSQHNSGCIHRPPHSLLRCGWL